ncbi:U3 small nucleolar RNA-associated protein [Erysiphe necator]|uniref:Putative u3 snornp wd40 family protein n=1 Tax=Uncinula necator TaxID=52586 RepID=A0A0B1PA14_UNCNE|nr:U3 small nucleolar RNA-associated protein [Erysiphe necator]KHJ33504.1 putative u3 snornp wd40 family protein [Erysiphe necator]
MDIHRCRFVPLPPSSINALEFSHSHLKRHKLTAPLRLAIGRANGDIEIWNPLKGSWFQETVIHGGKDRSIDGLVWIQNPDEEVNGRAIIGKLRLFSIGYTSTITEWSLATGQPLRQASGNHGEIWCFAAQPVSLDHNAGQDYSQSLAAGCTDGALVLYSTQDDSLQFQKLLVRPSSKKAKIISITYQNRNIVAAGCTDSTIRICDTRNGKLIRVMSLGSGLKGGPKDIIVWAIKALRDGTIISGDSTGELKIWDGKTYTLRQRILAHKQDVLCLTTNLDGSAIFSGGMDRRTVLYRSTSKLKGRWIEVAHRRFHSHDVKAMASFEGLGMNVIVSGGHDSSPIIVPIGKYGLENHRTLPFLPQDPTLRSASKARLIISWWDREIWIWRIEKLDVQANDETSDESLPGRELVAKVFIKGEANITSADIDLEGNILVVATITEIKAFQLRPRANSKGRGYQISQVQIPSNLFGGARLLKISPNGKWLCVIQPENQILLARLAQSKFPARFMSLVTKLSRIDRQNDKLVSSGGLGSYSRVITQLAFSAHNRILVVSDLSGYVDSFVLRGTEDYSLDLDAPKTLAPTDYGIDSDTDNDNDNEADKNLNTVFGQSWIRNPLASSVPQLPATPVVLSFRPSCTPTTHGVESNLSNLDQKIAESSDTIEEDRLLVATATSNIFEIEVLKGKLSDWSRRNPPSVFPEKYRMTLETVKGIIWDISANRERVWLYSISWLWMFDLGRDFPQVKNDHPKKKLKRKRGTCGAGGEIKNSEMKIGLEGNLLNSTDERFNGANTNYIDDDDDDDNDHVEISRLPQITSEPPPPHIFNAVDLEVGEKTEISGNSQIFNNPTSTIPPITSTVSKEIRSTYHTFKYRPIVGLVTLGKTKTTKEPEIALVERPIWDAKLPPRYFGEQEWRIQEDDGSEVFF